MEADRSAIQTVLYRYCRGVDRMDEELTRSCWHADGTANYEGMFEGTSDALLDWMWKVHAQMEMHSHQMTNMLIEVAGERAVSETYVTVLLRTAKAPGRPHYDVEIRGRYVDRWSKRAGVWAIDHRHYVQDLMNYLPVSSEPMSPVVGTRDRSDPSYAAFAELRQRKG